MLQRSHRMDTELPALLQDWLHAHPPPSRCQIGPIPSGWSAPVLDVLEQLDAWRIEPRICKYKFGTLRLDVRRPSDLSPWLLMRIDTRIARAQALCAQRCIYCGGAARAASEADRHLLGPHCSACIPVAAR
ncbi:hypothetical protein [Roseateles sp.]|uniref:hypothetical protein n=1 Tax=Roseateles sp. TaxID=1971397 RepID=UPI0039615F1A